MKKTISIIAAFILLFSALSLNASATNTDAVVTGTASGKTGDCTWKLDGTVLTISGKGEMKSYDVWEDDLPPWGQAVTEVIISDGVTGIGVDSFYNCASLKSVSIGASVSYIDSSAFENCSGITQLVVSNNNPVYDSRNNCNAIIDTESGTLIKGCNSTVIPDEVYTIGSYAFSQCVGLKEIIIPDDVDEIEYAAFKDCTGVKKLHLGANVQRIGANAFLGCTGIEEITVDENNTQYDSRDNCNAIILDSWVKAVFIACDNTVIPDSVDTIGNGAYMNCKKIQKIVIPDNIENIMSAAFDGCSELKELTIPKNVNSIGNLAAYGCDKLKSVTILSPDAYINSMAFGYTSGDEPIEGFTIIGYKNSTAETYAKENGFKFVPLDIGTPNLTVTLSGLDAGIAEMKLTASSEKSYKSVYNGNDYLFTDVPAGTYTLTISKQGYTTRNYTVKIGSESVQLAAKLNRLGDINGDGKVTTADYGQANAHARSKVTLTDYKFACADVTGDGKITTADTGKINSHARGKSKMW